ncbi:ABC transporter permease [Neomegalonema sp.]|uniref:MlaE family ABC transporter permease n=1 Tax=Neomegalonema sp. TaxID=2039713 RepID=UPI00260F5FCC|nr:ABC transporter permease [Neomegalonema sp.]MDD2868943.1 ABC transporter permease [Neomegalonema sp.]
MTPILAFLAALGRPVLALCAGVGRFSLFAFGAFWRLFAPPWHLREFWRQALRIGYFSLPVVGFTAVFTGAALALQIYMGGARFNAEQVVPSIVEIGILRELGPVLGALMVAGRVSAALAAEIGAMRVSEQIDALRTLSTDPMRYLTAPRLAAGILTMPLLILVADSLGIFGGYLVGVRRLGFQPDAYLQATIAAFQWMDVVSGLVKAAVFGAVITLMGCYHGFNAGRGAQGVGRAATNAVVGASALILATNYVLTELFFGS